MPKNEEIFFDAFQDAVGADFLLSKSIGRKIAKSDVFLEKNYMKYRFDTPVDQLFEHALKELGINGNLLSGSLAHNIDGLVTGHPTLGTCIVEFDEEQHFNAFRFATLDVFQKKLQLPFTEQYMRYCTATDYVNRMLKKHRLNFSIDKPIQDIAAFRGIIVQNASENNGYIKPKTGFSFWGGRIAQRAYYDLLRDTAHLSPYNEGFGKPLRLALYDFEDEFGLSFERISKQDLRSSIERRLSEIS